LFAKFLSLILGGILVSWESNAMFQVSFCFMHRMPGYRYEVECDEQAIGSHAKNLDVSYRSKGKLRFYTPRIKEKWQKWQPMGG
jgi:hypothetical protein